MNPDVKDLVEDANLFGTYAGETFDDAPGYAGQKIVAVRFE